MGEIKNHPINALPPVDRLLIAQAKYESMAVVTYDAIFQNYLNDVVFIRK